VVNAFILDGASYSLKIVFNRVPVIGIGVISSSMSNLFKRTGCASPDVFSSGGMLSEASSLWSTSKLPSGVAPFSPRVLEDPFPGTADVKRPA